MSSGSQTAKNHNAMGESIETALQAMLQYVRAYNNENSSTLCEDRVLGEGMARVLNGLGNLLNGDLGEHSGAKLSGLLESVRDEAGWYK